ncbi:MAG: Gfo/Idh/MocA family oxidoreductase [bacterium]|nr:Gfo/Idh/MocA family oxidoreductase [bacterium]
MEKIRIGVMGCANIAYRSVAPAIWSIPQLELVAAASRTRENAQRFANTFGCEAVVGYKNLLSRDDIDAVYMPLPTGLHHEWIPKCLESGRHVLAEKSLACDYESAKQMVEKAKETGLLLMENYMFQYHSQHQFVRNMIKSGEIGEIRGFRSSFGFPPLSPDNFRYNAGLGGGALLDAGGYPVKAAQFFLGHDLKAKGADLFCDKKRNVDIYGSAYLSAPGNLGVEISFGFDNFYQCNYEIWGSRGKLFVERAFTPPSNFKPTIITEQQDSRRQFQVKADNHFVNCLNEFYRAIEEEDFQKHLEDVLNQARLLDEIREAANEYR